jgi:hypothetical protein
VIVAKQKIPKISSKLYAVVSTCGKLWVNCGKLENTWGIYPESMVENQRK